MFWMFLAGASLVVAATSARVQAYKDKYKLLNKDGAGIFAIGMLVISAMLLIIGLIGSMVTYSDQVSANVELDKITQFEQAYQMRADNLTGQFKNYLAEIYPAYEKDIFSKIESGKLDVYLAKHPELQASKTITELVQQIRVLQDDIYKQRLARAETIRNMRYNVRSPWVYQWMMPNIPIPDSVIQ